MGYVEFLSCLFEDGRLTVPKLVPILDEEILAGDKLIAAYEPVYRSAMPGQAPRFVPPAARWAAIHFFRACQLAVYRDLGEETLERELGSLWTEPISPNVHYSVDLVFRYLPDFAKFAASAAEHDPLVEHLHRWATAWPLSSAGMPGIGAVNIDGFVDSASLLQHYVDRVMATGDTSRLSDVRVRGAVQSALGMFSCLDERMAKALQDYEVEEANE